jgi:hypothetical protein
MLMVPGPGEERVYLGGLLVCCSVMQEWLVALEDGGMPLFPVHRNGWWLVCLAEGKGGAVVRSMVMCG